MQPHQQPTGDPVLWRRRTRPPMFRPLRASWIGVTVAVASLLVVGCGGPNLAAPSEEGSGLVPAVEAVPARSGTLPLEERLSGVVKARNQVAIRPEISARVIEVLVRSGEAVQRGQPLVRLEDDTLREQLRQAEAAVRLAEAEALEAKARVAELEAQVTRTRALAEEELVSRLQVDTQEAQLDAAEASAARAEAQVEQARASFERALPQDPSGAALDGLAGAEDHPRARWGDDGARHPRRPLLDRRPVAADRRWRCAGTVLPGMSFPWNATAVWALKNLPQFQAAAVMTYGPWVTVKAFSLTRLSRRFDTGMV